METVRGKGARKQDALRRRDWRALRWSLMGVAVALSLAFAASSGWSQVAPPPVTCEDFTGGRECTAVDEWAFCVNNAMDDYEDCKEDAGFFEALGCAVVYDVNFWACTLAIPVSVVVK
jgi:hypothetical protein